MFNILMHIGGMPFNGDTIPSGQSLGGSESAAYYLAKALVKRGHRVDLFCNMKEGMKEGEWDGVQYASVGPYSDQFPLGHKFHFISQLPYDVCIIQRHPQAFLSPPNSKMNIWWLHDLALKRYLFAIDRQLSNIDSIFTVSDWHKNQVADTYGIDKKHIFATSNAFDYDQVKDFEFLSYQERLKAHDGKPSFVYAARPERGLMNLVGPGGVMEHLKDCKLYVAGYDNTTPQMRDFYGYLYSRCAQLPNVENVGSLGKNDLLKLLGSVLYYIYPTEFEETFCTMILESNAVGTPFLGTTTGALPSVMNKNGGKLFNKGKDGKVNPKKFAKEVNQLLSSGQAGWERMNAAALKRNQSWDSVAESWEGFFINQFEKNTKDEGRLAKHFEQHSDIVTLKKFGMQAYLPDYETNYAFFESGKYQEHYNAYYQYEADRGVKYGPEDLTGNNRFESIYKIVQDKDPTTLLDYGCAHGHYIMNILKRANGKGQEDLQFVGIDLEETNIEKALDWSTKEKENRVTWVYGDKPYVAEHAGVKKFDMIMLGEVLEHVPDPQQLLNDLRPFAHKDTEFVISVPCGPWESIGYNEHKGWRAHLHHFERKDLEDIFGDQKDYLVRGIPHNPGFGHWVVTYTASEEPYGQIDYERKKLVQNPRQTISLCMIAKDAEDVLARNLGSIINYVDEIIIGVDITSSEDFKEFLSNYLFVHGNRLPKIKTIEVNSPLEIGFDEARNKTIERATSNWILWMDSDEEFVHPERLSGYLRNNPLDGYGISQHHFTAEPAGLMKTDFPVRVFRNHNKIKFLGHVHEHPEKKLNEGVGKVQIIPSEVLSICHIGYITEDIRRKRFERNFPLITIDRKKNPDRNLGFFLWLRDLAHHCRYRLERNGGVVTEDIKKDAEEAVELWRRLITENKNIRFVTEGLAFYSECVRYLIGETGFIYDVNMILQSPKLQSKSSFSEKISGYFINLEDIDLLNGFLYKEITAIYREKYL